MEEIADALQTGEIELLVYHAEAAPGQVRDFPVMVGVWLIRGMAGQYEVVTGPLPPLEAADAVVFTHETIVNIAAKHGLRATFAPRVFPDSCNYVLSRPADQIFE